MGSAFHQRVAIVSVSGQHIRHVPAAFAGAMVTGGAARIDQPQCGRIRSVILDRPASSHAVRIGAPAAPVLGGVKFYRWSRLDESASRIIEHHPRCLYVL